jgi:hypothetical protein
MDREWACEKANKRAQFKREKQYGRKEGEKSGNEASGQEVEEEMREG